MSVNQIHELRKRSNQFVADLSLHISEVVDHNEKLLQLNKAQLKASKTAKGGSLVNSKTGSSKYTPQYAKKKGYSNPDLFVTGNFYKEMDIIFEPSDQYKIIDFADVTKYLVKMYTPDIFGINNKKKAQKITVPALSLLWQRKVLK